MGMYLDDIHSSLVRFKVTLHILAVLALIFWIILNKGFKIEHEAVGNLIYLEILMVFVFASYVPNDKTLVTGAKDY